MPVLASEREGRGDRDRRPAWSWPPGVVGVSARFCGRTPFCPPVGNRFDEALAQVLNEIPNRKVATCGAIAKALGDVRAARAVATWVADHPELPGGTKVVRADGRPVLATRGALAGRTQTAILDSLPSVGVLPALREEQARVRERVSETDLPGEVRTFGAVDVAYEGERAFAVAVRCDRETLQPDEIVRAERNVDFPYIPTYLAFREFPPIEAAVRRLRHRPDVLFVDGHGRLHPTLCGLACYAGVRLDLPTVGVAKHRLVGRPAMRRRGIDGAHPIELDGVVRGYAWAPPGGTRPIYVSVGHRIALKTALHLVRDATRRRGPEPLQIADRLSKEMKKEKWEKGGRQ